MSKLTEGTTFNTYDAVKKEIEDENAKYGPPAFLCILRSKRRKNGLKNYILTSEISIKVVIKKKAQTIEEYVTFILANGC